MQVTGAEYIPRLLMGVHNLDQGMEGWLRVMFHIEQQRFRDWLDSLQSDVASLLITKRQR